MNNHSKYIEQSSDKVSHHAQLGGIELGELVSANADNTRVAWINTGSGLRYQVLLDRGCDIGKAFFNQYALAWVSHNDVVHPSGSADVGINWLKYFPGGLLTTCGLDHIGPPEEALGLHGRISNLKSEIIQLKQPDMLRNDLTYVLKTRMLQSQVFGPHLELIRSISGSLGKSEIKIDDTVTNLGNTSAPHMQLYHMNFGYPLLNDHSTIYWKGKSVKSLGRVFGLDSSSIKCVAPTEEHSGNKEGVIFIQPQDDPNTGKVSCGIVNESIDLAVTITFNRSDLPCLTHWQHFGVREYVCALEPCTNYPIGLSKAKSEKSLKYISPGESISHSLEVQVYNDTTDIQRITENLELS